MDNEQVEIALSGNIFYLSDPQIICQFLWLKGRIMKRTAVVVIILLMAGITFVAPAIAEEAAPALNYSGDLWSRPALTGDWGGLRNEWARKGLTLDLALTQIVQSNIGGGKKTDWEYGGRGNLTLNIDTQKMGLWPGGSLTVEVEGNFGNYVNPYTGALMPVNANQIFPMPVGDQLNILAVTFSQFFSPYVGIYAGKLDTMTIERNEFAEGKGDTQFLNLAFIMNPVTLLTPYSALGAGVVILPTKDPNKAYVYVSALDADGAANRSGFDTIFKGNAMYAIAGRLRTDFFGLTGHQFMGATYSAKNYSSLDQRLRFFIESRTIEQKDNSWCFFYNFDQYLYEPRKGRGVGIFGRFGASDGNPNPMHYFYSLGVGGKGIIPGRELDQFGLGWYYIDVSNPKFTGPLVTHELLRDEQGFEAYYNFAVTPWLHLTPDIQVARGAQKQQVVGIIPSVPPSIVTRDIKTATALGFRLQIIF